MGLLDLPKKTSGRKITKNFLKKHNFYADRWGSIYDREKETAVFYEAFYNMNIGIFLFPYSDYSGSHTTTATIKYFPEEFDGYTTIGRTWGHGNVAGKLVIIYENNLSFEYGDNRGWTDTLVFDCKTHADFYNAIDCFNLDLIKKGYEPIRY